MRIFSLPSKGPVPDEVDLDHRNEHMSWSGGRGVNVLLLGGVLDGYDGQVFYLGLALDLAYVEGFIEGCLERIGEEDPDEEQLFRDLWEDERERETVLDALKADFEVGLADLARSILASE